MYLTDRFNRLSPVMLKLMNLINTMPQWRERFEKALMQVKKYQLTEFKSVHSLYDWLLWCNNLLFWIPAEQSDISNLDQKMSLYHLLLNQPSVKSLQSDSILSEWMVEYAKQLGQFMNSTASLTEKTLQTYYNNPKFHLNEYMPDPSGWKTFNQFFARRVKPGYRPIDEKCNDHIIVSIADSVFKGFLEISDQLDDEIPLKIKNIKWSIRQLLNDHPLSQRFRGGLFMHAFLSVTDYHRFHTPISGTVIHQELIDGNIFMETRVLNDKLEVVDRVGYQFTQTRGCILMDTPIGLVAILPIGMGLVSSVVITVEKDIYLNKGDEFGYFQFGGSDYIILFEKKSNVKLHAEIDKHYKQGTQIGISYKN